MLAHVRADSKLPFDEGTAGAKALSGHSREGFLLSGHEATKSSSKKIVLTSGMFHVKHSDLLRPKAMWGERVMISCRSGREN